jgi:hypothetical protein
MGARLDELERNVQELADTVSDREQADEDDEDEEGQ